MPLDFHPLGGPRRARQRERRRGWLPVLAVAAVALTGCSSSDGSAKAGATPSGSVASSSASSPTVVAPSSTPAAAPPVSTPSTTSAAPSTPAVTATPTPVAGPRPDDACTMLTAAQVTTAIGTTDRFVGTHPDPASDGSPVWGCTWGSHLSYASLREVTVNQFALSIGGSDTATTIIPGIGDQAVLASRKSDGSQPHLAFMAGFRYYVLSVVVDRGELGATNAAKEATAARELATIVAKALMG
ncbi:hypothetical protein [Kitasatospora sp. NPDC050543]|uniref:hypothetical protein n=1 Tax=Kitasatospora sp. NPDC050543 TaxID=3364054 RepID=UPI00379BCE6B